MTHRHGAAPPWRCIATALGLACAIAGHAVVGTAQAPAGSDKLTPAAVAESLAVMRDLQRHVAQNRDDAAAWHRLGMLAWSLTDRDKSKPPVAGLDWTLLGRLADSSLRIASQLAPENPQYRLSVGRFLLASGVSLARMGSYGFFHDAVEVARKGDDATLHADAAIESGRVYWRRYDTLARRWTPLLERPCDSTYVVPTNFVSNDAFGRPQAAQYVRDAVTSVAQELPPDVTGQADYVRAEELFREAFAAQPSYERAFRQLAMLLADRNRWTELGSLSRQRLTAAPWDSWAWLALGLASHRLQDSRMAAVAFDSGLVLLSPDDRARLDRIERILRPSDTTRFAATPDSAKRAKELLYWLTADPLWSRRGNEPRTEFLARATYAELRWTVDEMRLHGIETDRGDVYLRYGPADFVAVFAATAGSSEICTLWAYNAGLVFRFEGFATFATAHVPPDDQKAIEVIQSVTPARWDNIEPVRVDSIRLQAVRFRARDSVDVLIASSAPIDSIRSSNPTRAPVRADMWLLVGGTRAVARDSSLNARAGITTFRRRVAQGDYLYRLEATAEAATRAARAQGALLAGTDTLTGFAMTGFGLSDILLASSAQPRRTPVRWSDYDIEPLAGSIAPRRDLVLVWENYELGNRGGTGEYSVTIAVERERGAAGRIIARLQSAAGTAIGAGAAGDDRVILQFERRVAHAPALADAIGIALGDTSPGTYRITLRITDRVSGLSTSRTTRINIQ